LTGLTQLIQSLALMMVIKNLGRHNILIYSTSLEEHTVHLQQVFEILQEHQFYVKYSKCVFAQQQLEYLGHLITENGVATEPSKIVAVANWAPPKNIKQLRSFLGLTGYYKRFIKHYGMISSPLTQLLKKGVPFLWTDQAQEAFQLLKQALLQGPVLTVPDFSKEFTIETDASDVGFGAVLMQEGHPIAYFSKPISGRNRALSTYEECMAVLFAVEKWHSYLQHQQFIIKTDHKSLLFLTEQKATTKLQQKALLKLMDLNFKIQYKKGTTNSVADALSRFPEDTPENTHKPIQSISVCTPTWIERLHEGYEQDEDAKQLLIELSLSNDNEKGFTLKKWNSQIQGKGMGW
jgi:hypothetical protein